MISTRKVWTHPEVPWLLAASIVVVLALLDRFFIKNQASSVDQALDWITIISAAVGACLSWLVSYRTPLQTTPPPRDFLMIRIFLCWLIGPFLVVGAAFPANDIDGALLLFYIPFLGLMLTFFLLPWILAARRFRLTKSMQAGDDRLKTRQSRSP